MNFAFMNPRVGLRNWLLKPSNAEIENYLRQEQVKLLRAQQDLERLQPSSSMQGSKPIFERIKLIISDLPPRSMDRIVPIVFRYFPLRRYGNATSQDSGSDSQSPLMPNLQKNGLPKASHGREQSAHSPRLDQDGSQ